MSIFTPTSKHTVHVQPHIKDFIVERLKKGEAPIKVRANVERQFGVYVSMSFIDRTRFKYIKLTGEHLKSYREFHKANSNERKK